MIEVTNFLPHPSLAFSIAGIFYDHVFPNEGSSDCEPTLRQGIKIPYVETHKVISCRTQHAISETPLPRSAALLLAPIHPCHYTEKMRLG
jgi:hypothetical protein